MKNGTSDDTPVDSGLADNLARAERLKEQANDCFKSKKICVQSLIARVGWRHTSCCCTLAGEY